MPASKSAAASTAARAHSSHSDAAHRQEPPALNVHYVPARMPAGVVTGLWGGAVRREDDGSTTQLKLGDVVRKGDVLLTAQRGIVQLTVDGKQFLTTGDPELDKLVARLDDGELDFVTGAGGEGGEGSLQAGLVVDRVIEVVSPQEYQYAYDQYRQGADLFQGASGQTAPPVFEEADVVVSLVGPTSVVEGQTAANYTVTLSNPAPVDVTVTLAYAGVATAGSDFTAVTSVTIPAGQSSATFDIATLDDALAEGSEPFTVTIVNVSGNDAAIVSIDPERASVTTTITDDAGPSGPGTPGPEDTCLVSITGPDTVVEGEVAPGYTVSLSQPAVTDVVVRLTYSGTATDGSDFTAVTSVTIPAGQSSVVFNIATLDDALAEGSESFTVSLGEITGGGFEQIAGDPAKATVTTSITDDAGPSGPGTPGPEDTCLVSITGPDSVVEGETAPGYTVSLSQPAVTDVVVKLTYSGTATDGSDFTAVTSVTIPAGQSSAVFDIATLDDALAEGSESFTVSLGEITGGGFEAIAGNPAKATVTTSITDDAGPSGPGTPGPEDTCLVSISGPGSVVEGEVAPGYTVSLSQPAVTDVVVKLTYSGTATDGSDFTAVTSVTIRAGQSSAVFDVATLDDALAEGPESFTVSLGEITGGGFEQIAGDPAKASVTTSITDDPAPFDPEDTCLVSISGPDSVVEGETAPGYTVSLSQPAITDVIVKLTYSGTATDGSDFTAITSVTVPAGQTSVTFDIKTLDDALAEGAETITLSLGEITGGGFEQIAGDPAKASITTTLTDNSGAQGPEDTCLVSISGPDSVVEGETASGYTVSLSQPAVTDVVVKLTYSGTATDGSDFTAVTSITIPAGQSSAVFDIATLDDALAEGTESFTVSLGEITGGGFEQIAGDPAKASITTTLMDDSGPRGPEDTCLVSISGPDSVVEGETAPGYTISLSQPAVTDVVVKLTYSGTATDGSDFTAVTSVTIPAGQTSAVFDIATLDDALAEGSETITLSIGEITGGGFEQIAGDPAKATVTTSITDDPGPFGPEDTCLVSISGPDSVVEGETAPGYTVSLSQPAVTDVIVKLTYSGTATDGSDFTAVTSVTIPAGQSSATFDIATLDDALAEGTESFTVSLGEITGGGFEAIAGDPAKATVTTSLTDDTGPKGPEDTCLVSISGPDSVVEGETAPGYTVSLSQPAVTDVVVKLTYSGTATDGSDFTAVTSVTIPAGQTSATFDIATLDDALTEGSETITLSIGEITGGGFEQIAGDPAKASITTTLMDDSSPQGPEDTCLVSISGPDSVVEGETAPGYTVSLSQPAVTDVVVKLTYSGTATDGSDFTAVTSVTILAGQSSAVFDIATLDDALAEGSESFTVSLGEITGGGFEAIAGDPAKATVTTSLTDDTGPKGPEDTCLVSISGPGTVVEGETAPGYTVSLSQPAVTDVVVKLTYSGTATDGSDFTAVTSVTIPAGQSSAVFDIRTLDDALAEGAETITLSLGEITGGGFEAIAGDPAKATVTTTLTDDSGPKGPEDTCLVSITGPDSVVEGETAPGYTISLSQPAVTDVVVKLTYSGTATDGSDFTAVTSVTIPAGQTSAVFDIATLDDALAEGSESFTVSLGEITGGGFEQIAGDPAKASVTTSLTDDSGPFGPEDTCLVSISGPDSVVEGEVAPGYTVALSQPAVTDVVVKLTYSGTATDGSDFTAVTSVTIPAGQTSATFDIATLDDALAEGSESFTVSLGEITGGGFEQIAGDPAKASVTTSLTDDSAPFGPEDTCLVSISGPDSVVEGETAPGYTISLSQPAVTDVVVKLTYSGTATDGSDFTAVTSVTIPAGQSSAVFDIATLDDALAEGAESFTVSLGEITGGGFEQIAGDPAKASITTTLTDDSGPQGPEDTCLVSISGPDSVVEGETAPGYTVSLSQLAVTDVVVKLTYSGTATDGSDFTAVTSVTIPAGQSSAVFDIATLDDALAEGSESFTVSLGEITGGGFEQIAGDPAKASITTTLTDDSGPQGPEDTCLVSISGPGSVVEGETAPGYTVSLSQPAVTDVVVKLTYSGTATDGSDFTAVTSVTIPAGQSSAGFDIRTLDDALAEGAETITLSLGEITGGGFEAIAGDPAKATVTTTLTDDSGPKGPEDTCLVSISGPGTVVEGEVAPGYTVSLSQPAVTDVVVKLTYSGTATNGSDFTAVTSVTIPAGQSSATFDIATLDDALAEGTESFTVSLGEITGGGFEQIAGDPGKASITTTLTDDSGPQGPEDTCLVSISGPDSVVEGETAPGYTVSLSQPAVTDVVVKLTYSGTATDGSDFIAVTSVTIPAGQTSAVFDIATLDDALAEGSEPFTVSLGEITGGGFEQIAGDPAKASVTTSLTDDSGPFGPEDTCLVSISGPDSVVEGETAPGYTVSLSQPAITDVVIKLTYSGTATDGSDFTAVTSVTIPAGQTSATFDIATLDDALAEGSEKITLSIGEITGGGFEQIAGDPAKASITTNLTDDSGPQGPEDTCLVSISGPDSVVEGETAPGYTVSLSQPAVTDVVVKLTYSGTATDGSDFTAVTSVTIPAGQSSAVFDIATLDDALAEGAESFTVSLGEITGGGFEQIAGDPAKASITTTLTDDSGPQGPEDTCLVSISGPDSVVEGETAPGYTVSLSQPAVTDVVVKLTYSGTATDGSDFTAVTSVTILAGQTSAVFDIATLDDALAEGTESFTVSLGEITGGGFEQIAGDPAKASITTTLTDDSGPQGPEDTCLVSISGPGTVVEGETAPGYTVSLSQPAVTDVVVKLTYSGTATDGSDFTAVTSVTVPAGQSSVTFDIATLDDALAEGSETITLSIGEITGGGFEQIAGDPAKASITTTLTDDSGPQGPEDICLVSISGPNSVVEGEVAPGYTVSLSQPAVTDVVVKLTYSGTATNGSDFTAVTSVTIPAGQTSVTFDIATLDDALAEGSETITLSIGEITGGGFEQIAGDPAKASITTTLTDDSGPQDPEDTCLVSISGPDSVVEGETAPGYTVSLSQPAVTDVVVKLTSSGTATDGSDFTAVTSVTIPAGQSSATFDITTLDDALAEGTESFTVSLGEITGGGFEAIAGDPAGASITTTLTDDTGPKGPEDTCFVSISGPDSVVEGETAPGYTISLSQPAVTDVVVNLTYSGTATDGSDFTAVTSVTIPAGQSSAVFDIATLDDALTEGSETITLSIGEIIGGGFEAIAGNPAGASITTTLTDDTGPKGPEDTCLVSISGPDSVVEGETAPGYTVSLSQPAVTDVVVKLTYSGTATDGSDFTAVTSVTIPAGQSSATFDITTLDDALAEGTESFTVSLGEITGGGFEQIAGDPGKASITTTLTDDTGPKSPEDTCLVSISGPGSVVEGEVASGYTVSLSQPAVTDVVVKLTYSGTATDGSDFTAVTSVTVLAGQTSAKFDIATLDDAFAEGSESFTVSLGEITGGGFEQIAGDPGKAAITTTLIDDTGPKGPGTPGAEDTCLVSISGPDTVTEGEVASGYTVTLSQASTSSVTVQLSYSGTAESGADFTKVASITIPPGVTSYTFGISTQDDALAEGTEQFSVTLGAITGGSFEAIAADPARSTVSTSILDDAGPLATNGPGTPDAADQVLVSITGPESVVEGEPSGAYVVALSQPAVTDVVVRLVYSGTAADGADYVRTSSVTIPAGQSSTTFHLATVDDALAEGTETITVALGQISGGGFEEIAGDPAKASVTTLLHDDSGPQAPGGGQPPDEKDTVLVSLTGPDTVVEGDTASGYTVTLSQAALTDVQITLTYSGTASAGADYTPVLTVTVPAGQTSVRFDLPTQDDALAEGNETLIVALESITGGGFEAVLANPLATSVTTSLVDDVGPGGGKPGVEDTVQVSLTGPGQVLEGEIATGYTVTLSQAAVTDVVVKLNYSGTATDGSDYTRIATVTIPAGQTSTRFDIATLPDSAAEGAEQYTVALGAISGGGFEEIRGNPAAFSVTTTITDPAQAPTPTADQGVAREDTPVGGNVLDNDRDPDGNPLCVTSFTWGDVHHPVASGGTTTATLPGIGTLVVGPDGRYTFTPAKDYAGPVPEMSYTVSDGALTAVSTLTLSITAVNDAPTLRGGTATLSEEGLSGGIPDSSTETRATQATGTLQFSDVDSPSLRFTLEAPTGLYASGGKALVWTGDGSAEHPLLGTAGGEVILRATIDSQGRYTVDLLGPLDHPVRNTEDTLTLSLGVQVSDGEFSSTASLDVTVRDDSPTPFCSTRCADLDVVQNNLLITLDVSGSMGTRDGVNGETRLQSAIKSITKLIDSYDQQGEVAVRLVTFSTSAAERGDQWMSVAQAKSTLACLSAGGNTNYDAALDTARGAFTDGGRLDGGHNVAYFFSDGRPNLPTQDVGIDAGEAKVWQDFLNQHDIQSYAIGLGRDVPVSALDPVAWNGVTGADDLSPLLVSSFTQLDAVLAHTVAPAITGDVVDGGLKSVTGADGGHLSDIIVNGVHHPWDPATSASDTVSIKTAVGGEFTFNMETGHYTYQGPAGTRPDYQEVLQFTVTDGDGDSRSGQMTLKVNADGSSAFDGYCAPAPTSSTCLSGGVLSWTLADHQDSCSTTSTDSQCTSTTLQLGDVLGSSGSCQDTLSSWSGSGCTTTSGGSGSGGDPCLSGSGSTIDLQLAQTLIKQTADSLQNC